MNANAIPDLPCLCASLRRASRTLTQFYEEELRPFGLRASQFTILQTLSLAGEVSQGRLGEMLAMDSTTLTRTLAIMSRNRWIERRPGGDRRVTHVQLSSTGKTLLARTLPHWERVQRRVGKSLGAGRWEELMKTSNDISRLVAREEKQP
jgi:DNA-binding MarR family transcriptional regulator